MMQSFFQIPELGEISKKERLALKHFETSVRSAGWEILRSGEPNGKVDWILRVCNCARSPNCTTSDQAHKPVGWFRLERNGDNTLTVNHREGLALALEEIRRQFLAITQIGVQEGFMEVTMEPRVPLRSIRLAAEDWKQPALLYEVERYGTFFGFNSLILNALPIPNTNPLLTDETRTAEWEPSLQRLLQKLQHGDWWTMIVFPIELDLGTGEFHRGGLLEKPLCRQKPSSRRKLLHRFESLIRHLPIGNSVGFSVTDWGRCRCSLCEQVTFEEEAAYYLRAYSAVLSRYAPRTELWVLPDMECWNRLQEIRSQIPSHVRFLLDRESGNPNAPGGSRSRGLLGVEHENQQERDGESCRFVPFHSGGWLETDGVRNCLTEWDLLGIPRLVVTDLSGSSSLDLANVFHLLWRRTSSEDPEKWIYHRVLSPYQWKEWKEWKQRNELVKKVFDDSVTLNNSQGSRDDSWKGNGYRHVLSELAESDPVPTHHDVGLGPNLVKALRRSARRWLGEEMLRPVFVNLDQIPEGSLLSPQTEKILTDTLEMLQRFLDSKVSKCFHPEERHCLENLRDHLTLFLSDWKNKKPWRKEDLPDLWIRKCLLTIPD